jgi:hypothetical protein
MENGHICFNFSMARKLKSDFRLGIIMKEKLKLNIFIFQFAVLGTELLCSVCIKQFIVVSTTKA